MAKALREAGGPPKGLARLAYRAPIWIYRAGLGWLLGRRFLLLEHRGRSTGKARYTVLEVVADRPSALYVAAAWKSVSQWFRNVEVDPSVAVTWGRNRFSTRARRIDPVTARDVLAEYATNNARIFRRLARFMLDDPGVTVEDNIARVASTIPLVELPKPRR